MRRMPTILLASLLVALAAGVAVRAQEANPISEAEFISLVNAKTPPEQLMANIRARGVSFKLTPEFEASLKGAKVKAEVIELLKAPATLEIHANAGGAEVALDGQSRGALSPEGTLVLRDLEAGSHLIRLRAEGYVPAQSEVFLKPTENGRVELTLSAAVSTSKGPLGTRVNIQAGTVEDSVFAELEFEKDPLARVQKLEAIVQRYGPDNPMSLLAYGMLQESYLAAEKYSEAEAAGSKLLQRDPGNFTATVRQSRAAMGQGNLEAALERAARARQLLADLDQAPPPDGTSAETWAGEKQRMAEVPKAQLQTLSYELMAKANEVEDPARKMALFETFVKTFPQSPYRAAAYLNMALAAQQQGNVPKLVEAANRGLEVDPNQGLLLVMAATTLAQNGSNGTQPTGEDLARAQQLATTLLEKLSAEPEAIRLAGLSDDQWATYKQLWEGLGHLALGQVALTEGSTDPPVTSKVEKAIGEFKSAGPLLKADTGSYARNQFLLGFAYAKLGDFDLARPVLNEVVSLESPYAGPARNLLGQFPARRR